MMRMLAFDEAVWWVREALKNLEKMWKDKEVQWAMIKWDANKLRMVERSIEVPPSEWEGTLGEFEEEGDNKWNARLQLREEANVERNSSARRHYKHTRGCKKEGNMGW